MFLGMTDYSEKTFNWLNAERAAQIATICKQHGATVKRLAQKRGALGYCKIVARFAKWPGWASNREDCFKAVSACTAAGLVNSLTWQNS